MKTFQRLCMAFVLTLALAISAFAGDMTTGITSTPPPPNQVTTQGEMTTGVTGDMTTMATGEMQTTATDSVTQLALDMLQRVLSIF